ncbi:MAG: hydroxymethylbilane synthase [Myxococcota bacterium]
MKVRIGTRGSALALAQTHFVRDQLLGDPDNGVGEVEVKIIRTKGDKVRDVALNRVGGMGLFVKELEQNLLDGDVDLAVHSMKDMPSDSPSELVVAAVPEREDPRDAWVRPRGSGGMDIDELPTGAVVGTSSLRRRSQLLDRRPDLKIVPIRGNVETRLAKLDGGEDGMAAIVLACAGLRRLGLEERITRALHPVDDMIPSVGQGALGLQLRREDEALWEAVARLDHRDSRDRATAERAFLATVQGGCQVPVGAHAVVDGDALTVIGYLGLPDGSEVYRETLEGTRADGEAMGAEIGKHLKDAGGDKMMERLRRMLEEDAGRA